MALVSEERERSQQAARELIAEERLQLRVMITSDIYAAILLISCIKSKFHYADFVTKLRRGHKSRKVCDTNYNADFHDLCHGLL